MNERIKELAEQADKWSAEEYHQLFLANESPDGQKLFREKFAELIVQECIKRCDGNHEYKNHTDTDFGKGVVVGVEMCKEQIKEHFGVE